MEKTANSLAKSPEAWRRTALGLKRSADIIWGQWFEIFQRLDGGQIAKATPQEAGDVYLLLPTFLLLYGFAIENVSKGLLVAKDASVVESVIKWKVKGGGHDLRELYTATGLLVATDEQELLDALTQAVLWAGRYPVPKNHENKPEFGIFLGPLFKKPEIDSLVDNFSKLKKLCDKLYLRAMNDYPENETYRDREEPHSSPLPPHAAYGSVLRESADQASSDPGKRKSK